MAGRRVCLFCRPRRNISSETDLSGSQVFQKGAERMSSAQKIRPAAKRLAEFGSRPVSLFQIGSSDHVGEPERNRDPLLTAEPQEAAKRRPTSWSSWRSSSQRSSWGTSWRWSSSSSQLPLSWLLRVRRPFVRPQLASGRQISVRAKLSKSRFSRATNVFVTDSTTSIASIQPTEAMFRQGEMHDLRKCFDALRERRKFCACAARRARAARGAVN